MSHAQSLHWSKLPPLPDNEGFAAMYAGVSHETLLVAGGANFPEKRTWEGGTKIWYRDVWALEKPDGAWKKAGQLPRPLGYGVCVTWQSEVICAGGSNAEGHHADVFAMSYRNEALVIRKLPSLPKPCANTCGALIGDVLYVAGGIEKADATKAMNTFWSLDLSKPDAAWQELPTWPGPERMLATAGSHQGAFYLLSGAALHAGPDGKPERDWLKDAYRYLPGTGWEKLPDMPHVTVAACSPAPSTDEGLLVLCGDDGKKVGFKPETSHPGFPHRALFFNAAKRTWTELADGPFSRATVPTTFWKGRFVIPSGEARPGYRTPEVWSVDIR